MIQLTFIATCLIYHYHISHNQTSDTLFAFQDSDFLSSLNLGIESLWLIGGHHGLDLVIVADIVQWALSATIFRLNIYPKEESGLCPSVLSKPT